MLHRPLNVLQLSYRQRQPRVPQVLKIAVWALAAWLLVWALVRAVELAA